MPLPPLEGRAVRVPPGRVAVRLTPQYLPAYRTLYARYRTVTEGLPVLRDRDFDGRTVLMKASELAALNRALAGLDVEPTGLAGTPFGRQERGKETLFKRLQHLS